MSKVPQQHHQVPHSHIAATVQVAPNERPSARIHGRAAGGAEGLQGCEEVQQLESIVFVWPPSVAGDVALGKE
jgi:hypothetical protein